MTNKILVIDTENTGALRNHAHPFDYRNRMCLFGGYDGTTQHLIDVQYAGSNTMYGGAVRQIKELISRANILVGFNLKYDLHWLRRYNICIPGHVVLWDCQLAQFLISNQTQIYPSLDETGNYYKTNTVKLATLANYIAMGKDVDEIPLDNLKEYLACDLKATHEIYECQRKIIGNKWPLFNLQCQDLKVLQEMEWNGMAYDLIRSNEKVSKCIESEFSITSMLKLLVPEGEINWNSNYDVSAVLYGGKLAWCERVQNGVYKTGLKKGQPSYKLITHAVDMPRLIAPAPRSALMKAGYYSVAENYLRQLRPTGKAKAIIDLLFELGQNEKLRSTYLEGIPKVMRELNWENSVVHGSINQCVARTGRTSSNKPNLQNIPMAAKEFFVSRYD